MVETIRRPDLELFHFGHFESHTTAYPTETYTLVFCPLSKVLHQNLELSLRELARLGSGAGNHARYSSTALTLH